MTRKEKIELGDFQTPYSLAVQVTNLLESLGIKPFAVIEPNCGEGNFVRASREKYGRNIPIYGFDINPNYIKTLRHSLDLDASENIRLFEQDFFVFDWKAFFKTLPDNLLVIGNPPWVTNSALGVLGSGNLPIKSNIHNHNGFSAKTGKANFDISEWIIIKLIESLENKKAIFAMLCKTSTARKVLRYCWTRKISVCDAELFVFDAQKIFDVSVDACLIKLTINGDVKETTATLNEGILPFKKTGKFGLLGDILVSDIEGYLKYKDIEGTEYYKWRSGLKHDAASVMELKFAQGSYINGLGEKVEIEEEYIYPLLKSSDIANNRLTYIKYVIVTQKSIGQCTAEIEYKAPKTWAYLVEHESYFASRKSSIYNNKERFSIFGVGPYSFSQWKVAISSLYKSLKFAAIPPHEGKPIILDDTCYFIPCKTGEEARCISEMLNSEIALNFIRSLVFFDSKRPINLDILRRIDLSKLAIKLGMSDFIEKYLAFGKQFEKRQGQLVF